MRPYVHPGSWVLRPGLRAWDDHRAAWGEIPRLTPDELATATEHASVLGRGGAGFPFATKVRACAEQRSSRRHVVVNLAEGEPASAKDAALVAHSPHLILDGAHLVAVALGCRVVDLVVPHEHPWITEALTAAVDERATGARRQRLRWRFHQAAPRFVSGAAAAVTELVAGRQNLPVTTWVPAAVRGVHGRPTLLSNAETYAQVAALSLRPDAVPGPPSEPGTRLLSITRPDGLHVVETAHGSQWESVLSDVEIEAPVLLGGFHGVWGPPGDLRRHTVSASIRERGLSLGAGVVIPMTGPLCPLVRTSEILAYLAGQSAGRCGPCFHGLPALSDAFEGVARGGDPRTVERLAGLVARRGACSHPDGTVRLANSALQVFSAEVEVHRQGRCTWSCESQTARLRTAQAIA